MKDFVEIRNMGYGALIVAIVVLLPQGAAGGLEQIWTRFRRLWRPPEERAPRAAKHTPAKQSE